MPSVRPILFCGLLALAATPAHAQNWLETTIEIGQLIDAGDYDAAAELSETLLESAVSEFGEDSEQLAESHMIVAEIERANEDFFAAEGSLLSAIQVFERIEGPLSTKLIAPYSDLGDTYLASEEYDLAIRAYDEARGISRRAMGLTNMVQIPLLYKKSDTYEARGDLKTAEELQADAFQITLRRFGPASPEVLAARYVLADWLTEHEFYLPAGNQYRTASLYHLTEPGGGLLNVIRDLRLAAEKYRLDAKDFEFCDVEHYEGSRPILEECVESADKRPGIGKFKEEEIPRDPDELQDALAIALGMGEEQRLLQAEIWRDLGDWHVAFGRGAEIAEPYLRALGLLEQMDDGDELIDEWFGQTTPVYRAALRARELSTEKDAADGWVDLQFLIRENGTADRIEVIGGDPEGLLDADARRFIDNSRFRPVIENGQLMPALRTFRLEYRYDPGFVD